MGIQGNSRNSAEPTPEETEPQGQSEKPTEGEGPTGVPGSPPERPPGGWLPPAAGGSGSGGGGTSTGSSAGQVS